MSPELERIVTTLEFKATRAVLPAQERVLGALREAGAVHAATTIQNLIEQDRQRKVEALEEASRVRRLSRK